MAHFFCPALILGLLSLATVAWSGEFESHLSVAVSEEYTDNLFETPTNRISEFITRALPGVTARYEAPRLTGDLNYLFDYRNYARGNRNDEIAHTAGLKGHLTGVENLLYLDIAEDFQRVSLDVTRDTTKESLFVNQSDRNVVTASPYLLLHPTERISLKPGYRFIDTRYSGDAGINKTDHIGFMALSYQLMNRWSLTGDYTFVRELAAADNYRQHQALAGFRYEYAEKSFLFAQGGNTWTSYDSGESHSSAAWNAGITHEFDSATVTVTTGVKYDENPLRTVMQESYVYANVEQRFPRGTLTVSPFYSEYLLTDTNALQTRKYGATAKGQYELLTHLTGRLGVTGEKYEQRLVSSHTLRFLVDSLLSYLLAERLTLTLSYSYVDISSPGITTDNWFASRGMVEIRQTF